MLAFLFIAALQVVITPGPPGPRVTVPGTAGVRVAAPGSMSPAGNEIAQSGDLTLSNGYVMVFSASAPARGGFFIRNDGDLPDRLLSVSSPAAEHVTLYQIETTGERRGEVERGSIEIAPHSNFAAQDIAIDHNRGRIQLRFVGLRLPSDPETGIPVTFTFERTGPVTVRAFAMTPST
jgi:copper(I)-binding protein